MDLHLKSSSRGSPSDDSARPGIDLGGVSGARRGPNALAWFGGASLVLSLAAIGWFLALLVRDVEAANFTQLDATRARLDLGPGWSDPRWEHWMALRLAELPVVAADSGEAREQVEQALLELPFVAEVGATRVLWPDGLQVEVRLREPIACVRTGELFVPVAADGILLSGLWSSPPSRASAPETESGAGPGLVQPFHENGFLPLIALDELGRTQVGEGAQLTSAAAVDGLAVAQALLEELQADDWIRLGRFVIDARRAREASVEMPGVVLWLEGARRVYFGRSPNLDAPGELPYATKCGSLSKALRLSEAGTPSDWELADVRWDRPEILPRGGIDAPESGRGALR